MKRLILYFIILVCLGCSMEADIEGIILDIDNDHILLARNMTLDEYEEVKELDARTIQNEDVLGDTNYGLIDIYADETSDLQKGDIIKVWIDGDIMNSYPGQANAKKIKSYH